MTDAVLNFHVGGGARDGVHANDGDTTSCEVAAARFVRIIGARHTHRPGLCISRRRQVRLPDCANGSGAPMWGQRRFSFVRFNEIDGKQWRSRWERDVGIRGHRRIVGRFKAERREIDRARWLPCG